MRADADGRPASRVVEFDPKTMEVQWEFPGKIREYFHSGVRASQARLSNGNTLITESDGGRILEVTSDGKIAWEFYHPVRLGEKDYLLPVVCWAKRYSPSEIEFELSFPEQN
jgi:outer membrane protein assembly factor BamB